MGEFHIRLATAADVDRVGPLVGAFDGERAFFADMSEVEHVERRRDELVELLLDPSRPLLVAYSGIRAVGCVFVLDDDPPRVDAGWLQIGVEGELDAARARLRGD